MQHNHSSDATRQKQTFFLIVTGMIAGLASGGLGIGGGVIITPALMLLLRFPAVTAIQLSLAAIAPIALVGIVSHTILAPQNVNWFLAGFIVIGSLPGSWFGLYIKKKIRTRTLYFMFAFFFAYTALKISNLIPEINIFDFPTAHTADKLPLILLGFLAGIVSSIFGIGGGVIIVPILDQVFHLPLLQSIAVSLAVIVPTTLFGSWIHRNTAQLNKEHFLALLPAALIGAVLGGYIALHSPPILLRYLFSIILLLSAYKMFKKGMDQSPK